MIAWNHIFFLSINILVSSLFLLYIVYIYISILFLDSFILAINSN